ncbi:unnamed protein product [Discosporangium mesarthrocarpum]
MAEPVDKPDQSQARAVGSTGIGAGKKWEEAQRARELAAREKLFSAKEQSTTSPRAQLQQRKEPFPRSFLSVSGKAEKLRKDTLQEYHELTSQRKQSVQEMAKHLTSAISPGRTRTSSKGSREISQPGSRSSSISIDESAMSDTGDLDSDKKVGEITGSILTVASSEAVLGSPTPRGLVSPWGSPASFSHGRPAGSHTEGHQGHLDGEQEDDADGTKGGDGEGSGGEWWREQLSVKPGQLGTVRSMPSVSSPKEMALQRARSVQTLAKGLSQREVITSLADQKALDLKKQKLEEFDTLTSHRTKGNVKDIASAFTGESRSETVDAFHKRKARQEAEYRSKVQMGKETLKKVSQGTDAMYNFVLKLNLATPEGKERFIRRWAIGRMTDNKPVSPEDGRKFLKSLGISTEPEVGWG